MKALVLVLALLAANTGDTGVITKAAVSCQPGNIQVGAHAQDAYNLMVGLPSGEVRIGWTEFPVHGKLSWTLGFTAPGAYSIGLVRWDRSTPDLTLACVLP